MPTYEFRCPLGHEFEMFYRSIGTAEARAACPECGQLAERMMSAGAGLVFKGSGFYLTDYGKNAHQKKGPGDGKADGKSSDKGESGASDGGSASSKSEGASSGGESSGASSASGGESARSDKKSDSKPTESKPAAAPPKSSSGE